VTTSPQLVVDNGDPKLTRCAYDARVDTIDRVEITTAHNELLGIAELRYAPSCRAAWGRFLPSDRMNYFRVATIRIVASRPVTHTIGTPFTVAYDGQAAFGNILRADRGCVEANVAITAPSGGGSATTLCRP
jgi:hypothetical protein